MELGRTCCINFQVAIRSFHLSVAAAVCLLPFGCLRYSPRRRAGVGRNFRGYTELCAFTVNIAFKMIREDAHKKRNLRDILSMRGILPNFYLWFLLFMVLYFINEWLIRINSGIAIDQFVLYSNIWFNVEIEKWLLFLTPIRLAETSTSLQVGFADFEPNGT